MLGMILEMLDESGDFGVVVVDGEVNRGQGGGPELDVLEVDGVLSDPLRATGRLALVDGHAQVDVTGLVVRHLPGEGRPGLEEGCYIVVINPVAFIEQYIVLETI